MPEIRPIKDLRNTTEISELCHRTNEPVFITKNGYGDLVVMSMDTYKREIGRSELYKKLARPKLKSTAGNPFLTRNQSFESWYEKVQIKQAAESDTLSVACSFYFFPNCWMRCSAMETWTIFCSV